MITVAEVMKETSFCQPGNGRKTIIPTPKAKRMLNQGTPRLESLVEGEGMKPVLPSA